MSTPGSPSAERLRIVLASSLLADYPTGGGHWSCFLQYALGLRALGHEVHWVEVLEPQENEAETASDIETFFARFRAAGLADIAALVALPEAELDGDLDFILRSSEVHGLPEAELRRVLVEADLAWVFAGAIPSGLIAPSRRRVLIDCDPGIFQLSALEWDMELDRFDVFLTVGTKLGAADCPVPDAGVKWISFRPPVHLPDWTVAPPGAPESPFTSIVHWEWGDTFSFQGRTLLASKRAAYLRCVALPFLARRRFELAADLDPDGDLPDIQALEAHGWSLVSADERCPTPEAYRRYIAASRAEIGCAKEIYWALRTGWISDRSVAYLATGRPVVCEETGISDTVPVGEGLLTFTDMEGAVAALEEVDAHYERHCRAARELAEEHFAAARVLPEMVAACDG